MPWSAFCILGVPAPVQSDLLLQARVHGATSQQGHDMLACRVRHFIAACACMHAAVS